MRAIMIAVVFTGLVSVAPEAQAAGCLKGALVGGVAGHYAGRHAILGAVAGCIAGRQIAKTPPHHPPPLGR